MKKVTSWKDLSLREKIGQTVICLCETEKHIEMCGSVAKFAERYPIGGIFNNSGLVKGLLVDENPDFKKVVDEYNKHLRVPLFATADFANYAKKLGVKLPSQMALGSTDDEELAYKAGDIGGTMPTVLNGANEAAVGLFLEDKIKFLDIANVVEMAMSEHKTIKTPNVCDILEVDIWAREYVNKNLHKLK